VKKIYNFKFCREVELLIEILFANDSTG